MIYWQGWEKSGKITFQRSWALDYKSQFKFWYWHLPAKGESFSLSHLRTVPQLHL